MFTPHLTAGIQRYWIPTKEKVVGSRFFEPAVNSFGPRNLTEANERRSNPGIPFGNMSIFTDAGPLDLDTAQIATFCKVCASVKETVNLFRNAFDKMTRRGYNTHRNMCSNVNGDYLTQAFGGMILVCGLLIL